MVKNLRITAPKEWVERKRTLARQLGTTTPKAIIISEKIMAEAILSKKKGKRKIEVFFK